MGSHNNCIYNCGGTDCIAPVITLPENTWLPVDKYKPTKTGDYEVKYKGYSDDIGRYNRGLFGLSWLCYWSDEAYGGRTVTHWREIEII
jgi:hypothetical protein